MPKQPAFVQWKKLDANDQQRAIDSLPGFKTFCRKHPTYSAVYPERYLSQRRFDGFSPDPSLQNIITFGKPEKLIRYPGCDGIEKHRVVKLIADWVSNPSSWHVGIWGPPPGDISCQFYMSDLLECGYVSSNAEPKASRDDEDRRASGLGR